MRPDLQVIPGYTLPRFTDFQVGYTTQPQAPGRMRFVGAYVRQRRNQLAPLQCFSENEQAADAVTTAAGQPGGGLRRDYLTCPVRLGQGIDQGAIDRNITCRKRRA